MTRKSTAAGSGGSAGFKDYPFDTGIYLKAKFGLG
jgi:hypothetical protein